MSKNNKEDDYSSDPFGTFSNLFSEYVKKAQEGGKILAQEGSKLGSKLKEEGGKYFEEGKKVISQTFGEEKTEKTEKTENNSNLTSDFSEILNPNLPKPIEIDGYKLKFIKQLDKGGYSVVYMVRDINGTNYALKQMIAHDKEKYENIMREINVMKKISGNENIINLLGHSTSQVKRNTAINVLMDLADGQLYEVLVSKHKTKTKFEKKEILTIFLDLLKAVAHLHSQNPPIIHRDIKVNSKINFNRLKTFY
jgi:hypothetical protein